MKTLGEVFDSKFGIKLPQKISQGELTQLNINKQARLITLTVKFNGLVERNTLFDTEKLITKALAYHTVIKPHFPTELFSAVKKIYRKRIVFKPNLSIVESSVNTRNISPYGCV